jgi:hypothetical protein
MVTLANVGMVSPSSLSAVFFSPKDGCSQSCRMTANSVSCQRVSSKLFVIRLTEPSNR